METTEKQNVATEEQKAKYLALLDGLTEKQVEEALRNKYLADHVRERGREAMKDANWQTFSVIFALLDFEKIVVTIVTNPAKDIQNRKHGGATVHECCVWQDHSYGFTIENDRVVQIGPEAGKRFKPLLMFWMPVWIDTNQRFFGGIFFNTYGILLPSNDLTWETEIRNEDKENEFRILRIVQKNIKD